jgi:hypothetical protein
MTRKMKFSAPGDVVSRDLNGEAVLLNLGTGSYYGLDPVGTRMWELLSTLESVPEVLAVLRAEYDVDETCLKQDLDRLILELEDEGLLLRYADL